MTSLTLPQGPEIPQHAKRRNRILRLALILALAAVAILIALTLLSQIWRVRLVEARNSAAQIAHTSLGSIEYATLGSPDLPTLLILHGTGGGYPMGLEIARLMQLAERYHIVAVSRPGYLRTPLDSGETLEAQADLFAALLDTLGVQQVAVIGASGGAPSALQFAQRHPQRVWAAISLVGVTQRLEADAASIEAGRAFFALPPLVLDMLQWAQTYLGAIDTRSWVRQVLAENALLTGDALEARVDALLTDHEAMSRLHRFESTLTPLSASLAGIRHDIEMWLYEIADAPDFSALTVPTLALYGTLDNTVPASHGEYLAGAAPNVELHIDPTGGHYVFINERFAETQSRLTAFLSRHLRED